MKMKRQICKKILTPTNCGKNNSSKESKSQTSYQNLVNKIGSALPAKVQPFFFHPAGPTTVFFWAPTAKWGLVLAGLGDLNRPAETISLEQNASLMTTTAIWMRWSLVVIPKNWNLFSVNLFVCTTAAYNFIRGMMHKVQSPAV